MYSKQHNLNPQHPTGLLDILWDLSWIFWTVWCRCQVSKYSPRYVYYNISPISWVLKPSGKKVNVIYIASYIALAMRPYGFQGPTGRVLWSREEEGRRRQALKPRPDLIVSAYNEELQIVPQRRR
ncbi:uncharacterized protein H6S33_000535 [Morchella sextelata]|uniref:uncharacterized protein n=1 Tax=Morchella sextelata TaxID=1174677 RepID=UPI001D04B966|nr:uncharacterized protein H6S33_000535 [Morchella sextelata]KAH0614899.1 hypothetical protein H6S33_000535 [Morchella sextelata]